MGQVRGVCGQSGAARGAQACPAVGAAQRDTEGIWLGADGAWAHGDGSSAAPHPIHIFLKQQPLLSAGREQEELCKADLSPE